MIESIGDKRIRLALAQVGAQDGFAFEAFANAFLASEFPGLRPVGGIHDGGRDAFVHRPDDEPETFVQSSVTTKWEPKIRKTLRDLKKNGFAVRTLIYASPRDINRNADSLKRELRKEGIHLDVRDCEYFATFANTESSRVAASVELGRQFVDPLLEKSGVVGARNVALNTEEEQAAILYLQLTLGSRNPERNLTKTAYESMVLHALRGTNPDAPLSAPEIVQKTASTLSVATDGRLSEVIDGVLKRLKKAKRVTVFGSGDAYCLAHSEREQLKQQAIDAAAAEQSAVHQAALRLPAVAEALNIDYIFPSDAIASDSVMVAHRLLCNIGQTAAKAFATGDFADSLRSDAETLVGQLLRQDRGLFRSSSDLDDDQILDLIPPLLREVLVTDDEAIRSYFRSAADAYFVMFLLRGTRDVRKAFDKIVGTERVIIDASIVIPVLAETALPPSERKFTGLLKSATAAGIRLILVDDVVNEVESHLHRLSLYYAHSGGAGATVESLDEPLLVSAFKKARRHSDVGSFDAFVEQFMGRQEPTEDLIDYLVEQIGLEYLTLEAEYARIKSDRLEEVFHIWKQQKKRRPWVDQDAFETLVWHDVRSYLVTEATRSTEQGNYGHMWWWLTLDGTAFRLDRKLRNGKGVSMCMSPDFFLRYLSLTPKTKPVEGQVSDYLPVSAEMSTFAYLPPDVRDAAAKALAEVDGLPQYRRRRKLRELLNVARSELGDVFSAGLSELETQLEEGYSVSKPRKPTTR